MKTLAGASIVALAWAVLAGEHARSNPRGVRLLAPVVDHHQHFFNPALLEWAKSWNPAAQRLPAITAKELIALLDSAGIRRAVVLSVAYQCGNPAHPAENEYERVKAENDWTSAQVALYPDRLRGFCGVNPLRDYALEEIARCAGDPNLRTGLKLHFGNSDVNVSDPAQLAQLRRVFRAANANHMAIVVHAHANVNNSRPYGAREARIFLDSLVPDARDVPVQIAHLAGAGSYTDSTDRALAVYAEAIAKKDPRTAHLYFDMSGIGGLAAMDSTRKALMVSRIRSIGLDRILFGSDAAAPGNTPRDAWERFRTLPLSDEELTRIAGNVAPYMK